MPFQHIDAFVRAANKVIETMLHPGVEAGKPYFNEDPLRKYEICILVGVLGDLQGQVICGMSEETAKRIIAQMLGTGTGVLDEMGKSAICELKNIIIGTASTNLSLVGYRCNITPPLLLMGGEVPDFLRHIHTALAVPLLTEYGGIDMNLALRKDDLSA
ncbi:MAG: chemotaxis protein CheX [Bacteroidota bacterium]